MKTRRIWATVAPLLVPLVPACLAGPTGLASRPGAAGHIQKLAPGSAHPARLCIRRESQCGVDSISAMSDNATLLRSAAPGGGFRSRGGLSARISGA